MTIVQALKNLVTAFGGTSTAKTASEAIEDVATAVEAGGSGLPSVTSTDNGDILKVVEGAWAKAEEKTELPDMSGASDGDVLTVDDGSAVWSAPFVEQYAGYDIVVTTRNLSNTASDYTFVKIDSDAILAKVRAGDLVTGVLVYHYNYDQDVEGDTVVNTLILTDIAMSSTANKLTFDKFVTNGSDGIFGQRIIIEFTSNGISSAQYIYLHKTLT